MEEKHVCFFIGVEGCIKWFGYISTKAKAFRKAKLRAPCGVGGALANKFAVKTILCRGHAQAEGRVRVGVNWRI